jgi:N-acyl-L-homoserine lactone synthetase
MTNEVNARDVGLKMLRSVVEFSSSMLGVRKLVTVNFRFMVPCISDDNNE